MLQTMKIEASTYGPVHGHFSARWVGHISYLLDVVAYALPTLPAFATVPSSWHVLATEGRAVDLVHTDGSTEALCTSAMLKVSQLKKRASIIIHAQTIFKPRITAPNLPQELTSMMM